MGRQRNRPHMKEQVNSPEERDEMEACNLSEREFRVIIIRVFNNMKKDIETIKKDQSEIKSVISEINNTLEGINSRLDEAEDQISNLEDKVEKNTQAEQQKEKTIKKNEESLRNLWDNMKHNNIHTMGIPEGEESKKGIKNLFEEVMTKNFPNLVKEKDTQVQEAQRVPNKLDTKRPTMRHTIIKMTRIKNRRES